MPIWGRYFGPFPIENRAKTPKMVNYISNREFGENSVKIRPKNRKVTDFQIQVKFNLEYM